MSFEVSGKTALVTGAGSGINFALAQLLLSKNCNVVIADLSLRPEAKKHYDQFTSSPRALFVKTDVTSWKNLSETFEATIHKFGKLDILVPGAGLFDPPFSNFWYPPGSKESRDDPFGDRYLTVDVNITHPIRATQLALSHWMNPPEGQQKASTSNPKRIVVTASIAGYVSAISYPIYFATKHAMVGFVRSLADLNDRYGIKVAAVAPGGVVTPMLKEDKHKSRTIDWEQDKLVTPEEVADLMYRLMVDDGIAGGSVIEITENGERLTSAVNDPGPAGGVGISHGIVNVNEVYDLLNKPGWGATEGKDTQKSEVN